VLTDRGSEFCGNPERHVRALPPARGHRSLTHQDQEPAEHDALPMTREKMIVAWSTSDSKTRSRLCLFPSHRRVGSHVPYKSLVELRAAYMPDAAWSVSGHPPSSSRRTDQPPVLTSSNRLLTLLQRLACARLSQPCLSESRVRTH